MHMAAALAGVEKPWLALAGPLLTLLAQNSPCRGTIFGLVGSIQSRGALTGQRALTIESSLISGCGWGYEPKEIVPKKL